VNINGAVDAALETVADFMDSVNAPSAIRLFEKLEAKHPQAKEIYMIPDNARYYRSEIPAA
jgi:hypothetical protein